MNGAPSKYDLLGTAISGTDYDEVADYVIREAIAGRSRKVTCLDVHGLARAAHDAKFRSIVNSFDVATPDGTSLKWGLNLIHGLGLKDRVAGPDLTLHICSRAANAKCPIFAYGSHPHVVEKFTRNLSAMFPGLIIAGYQPSRFRPATPEEDDEDVRMVRESGARLVFVGLGSPLQETWAHEHASELAMPLLCIGAAFDFHSGYKRRAPMWMQNSGLEWAFRIATEPTRVGRRLPAVPYVAFALLMQRLRSKRTV